MRIGVYEVALTDREQFQSGPGLWRWAFDRVWKGSGAVNVASARWRSFYEPQDYTTTVTIAFDSSDWTGRRTSSSVGWRWGPVEWVRVGVCWLLRVGSLRLYGIDGRGFRVRWEKWA